MYLFHPLASSKFNLPNGSKVILKDSAGVDVDADIFDELVRSSKVSFKVLDGEKSGKKLKQHSVMFT